MSRSIWKPIFLHPQVRDNYASNEISVQNRSTSITQSRVGRRFQIYNGIRWYSVEIIPEMVGHCLGEFTSTRKRPIPKKKKVIKKK